MSGDLIPDQLVARPITREVHSDSDHSRVRMTTEKPGGFDVQVGVHRVVQWRKCLIPVNTIAMPA